MQPTLIDTLMGRYISEDEMKIGDRQINDLVEVKRKNHQLFRNYRKFENQCKRHPIEEKSRLVMLWSKKMLKTWEAEMAARSEEYSQSAAGKQEKVLYK